MEERDSDDVGEYMEIAIQFGLILLFSNVLPMAGLLCFLFNMVKLWNINSEFEYKRRN